GFNTTPFSFNRVAVYPEQAATAQPDQSIPEILIVPVSAKYQTADFTDGLLVGALWDVTGHMGTANTAYEVFFFNDRAELRDASGKTLIMRTISGGNFVQSQQDLTDTVETLAFFVQGSCWGCWNIDGRCGCLICL